MGTAASSDEKHGEAWVDTSFRKGKPQHKSVLTLYDLKEELGSGAYSTVFRGTPKKAGTKDQPTAVAVKRVAKKELATEEDVEALLLEVGILGQVHHPHIMRLYGFYEDTDFYNVVSEIVEGGELFDRIVQRNHYDERHARDLSVVFLQTLDFLHSHGIAHRDLKPENLLLSNKTDDCDIKIADFGFAKHTSERLDTVCGTPDYIAPEVCALLELKGVPREKRPCYGTKCDIWSAGVIFYILLAGYPPFFDENRKKLFRKIKSGRFEFHDQYWGSVSPEAKDFIRKCLTVDPNVRWSAKQLLSHPWVHHPGDVLTADLTGTQLELKRFNAKRRFRAAVHAVLISTRLSNMVVGETKQ
jgi:calcium/calmodulin-dependent protein kinase I